MFAASLTMSHRALDRGEVVQPLLERRLSQQEAATMLGLRVRQAERLLANCRAESPARTDIREARRAVQQAVA